VVVAGDPLRSPLHQFISGLRGEAHRMPLGGPPLVAAEVEIIRRWIAEGAREDADEMPSRRLTLSPVRLEAAVPLLVRARISVPTYLSLELTSSDGTVLYADGGAVRADRGVAAIGIPGEWLEWNLRRATGWPAEARVSLILSFAASDAVEAELTAGKQRAALPRR
jgi:hypothetical protein